MEESNKALAYLKTTRDELKPLLEATKEASENISTANQLVLDEIVEGYEKIKSSLK